MATPLPFVNKILDIVYPPICLLCKQPLSTADALCAECWCSIDFCSQPCCYQCGAPLEFTTCNHDRCGECHKHPPSFDKARSVFMYNDASKSLIIDFKFRDRWTARHLFTKWLYQAGLELFPDTDIIAPVPLHKKRLFKRCYNQAALLAASLSKHVQKEYIPDLLLRTKHTPPQIGLSAKARQRNLRGAFSLNQHYRQDLTKKSILLIDDVRTTSATAEACSKTLLAAGAAHVTLLTLGQAGKSP